jgi:hypothetical protein
MKQVAELLMQALVSASGSSQSQNATDNAMSGDFEYRNEMVEGGNR